MKLKLYNTLNKKISEFIPLHGTHVGLYACGFTTYDYTHLGHLRKYTMDDVLVRALRYGNAELSQGLQHQVQVEGHIASDLTPYEVTFVQNITDVGHLASDADTGEDKLEKGAKKYGKSVWEVAREFEEYFFRSMDLIGNVRPDVSCRATEHIQEQLDMVIELQQQGYTYVIDGDGVYFDTSKFPDYAKLASLNLESQEEGARIGVIAGKRNPSDFALWKFERPGENRAMVWSSPWHNRSFPGWHIECSAMSMKYLGDQIDIHTGGIDHIPVHHTNEIAQSESVSGKKPFVRYWVHHNMLRVDGVKMSKSLGNFFTIDDVLNRGFHPRALRLLFLTTHYRSEMNFLWENLAGAQKSYEKLLKQFIKLEVVSNLDAKKEKNSTTKQNDLSVQEKNSYETALKYAAQFFESLARDLNTPQAVSVVWSVLKDTSVSDFDKKSLLLEFDKILGLGLEKAAQTIDESQSVSTDSQPELPEEIRQLVEQRIAARETKNYGESDRIRDEILKLGYEMVDQGNGIYLTKKITK